MLQCTAVTAVPYYEALLALATMEGGPEHPPEVLAPDEFLLCELGEHDDAVEHAAHVWTAQTTDDRDLWLFWAGTGAHRVHRLDVVRLCPAVLRDLVTRTVTVCAYFDHHPGPHSFSVTDPLGELITERADPDPDADTDTDPDADTDSDTDTDTDEP